MEDQQREQSLSSSPRAYPPTQPETPYPSGNFYAQRPPYSSEPGPLDVLPRRRVTTRLIAIVAGVTTVVLIGAIVLVVVSRNGSGQPSTGASRVPGSTQASQAAPQSTTAPTTVNSPAGPHKVGDVVTIDGWQVTVLGVKTSLGGQFDTLQPGNVYLEIDVALVNQTDQTQLFASLAAFTLKDGTGQTYQQTFVSEAPAPPDGRVIAGGKLRGTVTYQVPSNNQTFEFDVTPNVYGENADVAVWNLHV